MRMGAKHILGAEPGPAMSEGSEAMGGSCRRGLTRVTVIPRKLDASDDSSAQPASGAAGWGGGEKPASAGKFKAIRLRQVRITKQNCHKTILSQNNTVARTHNDSHTVLAHAGRSLLSRRRAPTLSPARHMAACFSCR